MPIIILLALLTAISGCSPKSDVVYDPFAQVEIIDEEQVNTTERIEDLAFRYYHDMQEPSYLNYLQGIKESYRFTFTGDYEPDLIIRINHWAWSDSYSISVKKRKRNSYHVSECIRDAKTENIYNCPPTSYSKISNKQISKAEWDHFKLLLNKAKFWSEDNELHPPKKFHILHGTHWAVEAYRDIRDVEMNKEYSINTPRYGTNIYKIGSYILALTDEEGWLDRTKEAK